MTLGPSAALIRAQVQSIREKARREDPRVFGFKAEGGWSGAPTLEIDGESSIAVNTMLTIVSNVPLIGPNVLVYPNASLDDGLFDVSVYPNFSKAELLAYSTKVMNQNSSSDGTIQRYRAHRLKIKASPKQEVMADGVMLGKGPVKIKVLPGALRVFAPKVGAGVEKLPEAAGVDLPAPVAPAVVDPASGKNGNKPQPEAVKS